MVADSQAPPLSGTWHKHVGGEFEQDYMKALGNFLRQERAQGHIIYPKVADMFNAFHCAPFEQVKVVILGQDPYHGPDQAHGLCFSVPTPVRPPPSLLNIISEVRNDTGLEIDTQNGSLMSWAKQGVLLLNSVLSVRASVAASHAGKGWERFTDKVVEALNAHASNIVFMLWGRYAQRKGSIVDRTRHLVLEAAHPSPLSQTGFFGCKHFSQSNEWLAKKGISPIDWCL